MGVNAEIEFPVIEFRPSDLKRGTDGWHRLCKRVREACETFGCFEVVYEKISAKVREETFELMKELIEVPVERKQKNVSPLPYHGWVGPCNQVSLLYEGFGLGDASNYDSVKSFAQLMWPDGHPRFWGEIGVCDDKLQITAVNHIVMMSGDKDRFSIATFAMPVEGTIIKAPKELVDEQHPQLYKDFDFMDFFLFAFSNPAKQIDSGEQLQALASLSPPISD
ncbi:hypothetical protein CXB51_036483 [Gossypium anomalum]|uniref:Non-haem dioxygenase N-terminal domain-containing protein n=1 Tax=Gossypium anomalum TaxID=47600 RepID=A0A8J5Y1N9_9ROSI|nr:hypothetical protein CXB51_036483 [Gossypium anomalum]